MQNEYQYNLAANHSALYDVDERINKAQKTIKVLEDFLDDLKDYNLLDIGCSTGIMTKEYSNYFKSVLGIDLDTEAVQFAKKKYNGENIKYIDSPLEELDLRKDSIDVITCSHIYEHVPSAELLFKKIYELLKRGGVCYFAAGNRYKVIEPHYNLPFLSYLPKKIANVYLSIFKKEKYYYENLMSLRNLKKLVKNFEIHDYTLEVIKYPSKYSANEMITEGSLKYRILNFVAQKLYFIIPTYIWILRKPS